MPRFTIDSSLTDTSINKYITSGIIHDFITKYRKDGVIAEYGQYFIDSANKYGINVCYFVSHAISETGWGTSYNAKVKNNFWGYMAYDSNPDMAKKFDSPQAAIDFIAAFMSSQYFSPSGTYFHGATIRGMSGTWWTSQTQGNTIVQVMNMMMSYMESIGIRQSVEAAVSPPLTPVAVSTANTDGRKQYTIKGGGWRWNVVDELIRAGLYTGSVEENLLQFNKLNPVTPPGGWKAGQTVIYAQEDSIQEGNQKQMELEQQIQNEKVKQALSQETLTIYEKTAKDNIELKATNEGLMINLNSLKGDIVKLQSDVKSLTEGLKAVTNERDELKVRLASLQSTDMARKSGVLTGVKNAALRYFLNEYKPHFVTSAILSFIPFLSLFIDKITETTVRIMGIDPTKALPFIGSFALLQAGSKIYLTAKVTNAVKTYEPVIDKAEESLVTKLQSQLTPLEEVERAVMPVN